MQFMTIVKGPENAGVPPQALIDAVDKMTAEQTKAGTMLCFGGLGPSADGAKVRTLKGKVVVTDGPFTEAKEVIGGFAIVEYATKAEAVDQVRRLMDLHTRLWPSWEGECEVRALYGFSPPAEGPKAP